MLLIVVAVLLARGKQRQSRVSKVAASLAESSKDDGPYYSAPMAPATGAKPPGLGDMRDNPAYVAAGLHGRTSRQLPQAVGLSQDSEGWMQANPAYVYGGTTPKAAGTYTYVDGSAARGSDNTYASPHGASHTYAGVDDGEGRRQQHYYVSAATRATNSDA